MVVPAQPVGGARHDRQQRSLGHPAGDRRGQVLRGRRCARTAAPLERGDPAFGDDQVGVVFIPGIQGRGRVQVGAAQPLNGDAVQQPPHPEPAGSHQNDTVNGGTPLPRGHPQRRVTPGRRKEHR